MYLTDSFFNEVTYDSYSVVYHNGKEYMGVARLHPDDKPSKFAGCAIAETRAEIKALKDELKQEKAKCEEIRKFVKACRQYKDWDDNSKTAKLMYRQLSRRIKNVNRIIDEINARENGLQAYTFRRDIVVKALENKMSEKEQFKTL